MRLPFMPAPAMALPMLAACLLGAPSPIQAASYKTVYAFQGGADGEAPVGKLTPLGNALYGATYVGGGECDCGTVYRVKEDGTETVLHAFTGGSEDGAYPAGGLAVLGGDLSGATAGGGMTGCNYSPDNLCGTIYEIGTRGAIRILHAFESGGETVPSSDLTAAHDAVWGTSFFGGAGQAPVFKTAPSGKTTSYNSTFTLLPTGALLAFGAGFYGTTQQSSNYCNLEGQYCGTIYNMTRDGQYSTFYEFRGGTDGSHPGGTLARWHNLLFGTSTDNSGGGAVFKISSSGMEKTLHTFTGGNDGSGSINGLLEYKGTLYGTTPAGGGTACGGNGCGTIFSVKPGGAYKVLYRFAGGTDGANPQGQLVEWNGFLYGTTGLGGGAGCNGNGCGTVFRIKP